MKIRPIREWNIIGRSKLWFTISLIIIIIGIVSLIFNQIKIKQSLNFGIDFTGGAMMRLDFEKAADVALIREILSKYGQGNSTIQLDQRDKSVAVIRMMAVKDSTEVDKIVADLEAKFGKINRETFSIDLIGPTVGAELRRNAVLTVSIALLLILMYISIRFKLKFGLATILALVHDLLVTIGVLALTRVQLNFPSVAALLSITAYSVQDSIVVLDRLRENLKFKKERQTFAEIANKSVTETWTRSFNTSFTTVLAVIVLAIWGGVAIRDFTTILIAGLIAGTYSSIYIVVPLLVLWEKRDERIIRSVIPSQQITSGEIKAQKAQKIEPSRAKVSTGRDETVGVAPKEKQKSKKKKTVRRR